MKSPGEFNLKRIFQLIKDKFDALATVANTGDYDDLSNTPEIVEAQTITLSTVATSGNYEDLSNKPTQLSEFTNDTNFITSSNAPVQSVNGQIGTIDITDISGNAATATQATKDGNGHIISDTYLPLTGGSITNDLNINGNLQLYQYYRRVIGGLGAGAAYANLDDTYKDGTYHRMWRLRFPANCNFWGKIQITLYGTYSSFNASGIMSKTITCNFNGASLYNNLGYYTGLGVNVEKDFRISEAIWNAEASSWEILIWQQNLSGNNSPSIVVEGWYINSSYLNSLIGMTAQPVELTQNTSYTALRAAGNGGTKTVIWSETPVFESPLGYKVYDSNNTPLATVATSGSYNDLSNKPTISNDFTNAYKSKLDGIAVGAEVNVQSDWNAVSGDAVILNKPTITQVKMKTWTSDDIGGGG